MHASPSHTSGELIINKRSATATETHIRRRLQRNDKSPKESLRASNRKIISPRNIAKSCQLPIALDTVLDKAPPNPAYSGKAILRIWISARTDPPINSDRSARLTSRKPLE